MVVLAASILTGSGKVLVSRQFVDMSRIRIEGLLGAFANLVDTGKQHTCVETEDVRYVYQPIEPLYLVLVTNKHSNILQDLETLRQLSKLNILCGKAFELMFAFHEVISFGQKENVTVAQVQQYCKMESHEEKLHKQVMQKKINETRDVMKSKASEIAKIKSKKNGDGYMSLQSMCSGRIKSGFNEMSITSTSSGSSFGMNTDIKGGLPVVSAPSVGMKLGKSQRTNPFLESLKAEGETIL